MLDICVSVSHAVYVGVALVVVYTHHAKVFHSFWPHALAFEMHPYASVSRTSAASMTEFLFNS